MIEPYSITPVDVGTLVAAAAATQGRVVGAEDPPFQGGLGSAVAAALLGAGVRLRLAHLSVSELPGSDTAEELLSAAVIDAPHIAAAAGELVDGRRGSEPTERRSDAHGM